MAREYARRRRPPRCPGSATVGSSIRSRRSNASKNHSPAIRCERGRVRAPGSHGFQGPTSGLARGRAGQGLWFQGTQGGAKAVRIRVEGAAGGEAPQGTRRRARLVRQGRALRSGSWPGDEGVAHHRPAGQGALARGRKRSAGVRRPRYAQTYRSMNASNSDLGNAPATRPMKSGPNRSWTHSSIDTSERTAGGELQRFSCDPEPERLAPQVDGEPLLHTRP